MRSACRHDVTTFIARIRPHVDHPVGLHYRAHFVLDHHHGIAGINEALQLHQQPVGIRSMQPGGWFIEHIQAAAALAALQLGCELDALSFATRKLGCRLADAEVTQSDLAQELQWPRHCFFACEELARFIEEAVNLLETDGRLVVISYHSLEDRIVKNTLRDLARGEIDPVTGRSRSEAPEIRR